MAWFALIAALAFGMFHGFVGLPHLASAAPAGHVPTAETSMAQGGAPGNAVRSKRQCVTGRTPRNAMLKRSAACSECGADAAGARLSGPGAIPQGRAEPVLGLRAGAES